MPPDFQIGHLNRIEEPRVNVCCDHRAGGTHPLGQPEGDRATTGADFQALPARANSTREQNADGAGVEDERQPGEAPPRRSSSELSNTYVERGVGTWGFSAEVVM
jgi:hypothetical protein